MYIVRKDGQIETIVLPVHGYGLWSTMYAFVALNADGRTIKSVSFYEHGETPGLGAEVEIRNGKRATGKEALAEDGTVLFKVKKGLVERARPRPVTLSMASVERR